MILVIAVVLSLSAQVSGGAVSGTVMDGSQAPIPGARITVANVATSAARAVSTDAEGFYTVPDLLPGMYEMTIGAEAFTTQVRTNITMNVGASLVINVVMQPGDPTQLVRASVSGSTDQTSSAVGGNVSSSTVRNTPLNGRDWTQLATLQAGVTGIQTGSACTHGARVLTRYPRP